MIPDKKAFRKENIMEYLANDFVEIVRAPKGKEIHAYTPAICVLESGRYVFSGDFGGKDVPELPEYASITTSPPSPVTVLTAAR